MKPAVGINWKVYLIEAWGLGLFMLSASFFVVLIEHPYFLVNSIIPSSFIRRIFIGAAMGLTAVLIIYSKWGKLSGSHINPAVTLANYSLNRISLQDAIGYIVAQIAGATVAMLLLNIFFHSFLVAPSVNYIITMPGQEGVAVAVLAEFIMSFVLFTILLVVSNGRFAKYTGWVAGLLVCIFISVEAPLSGMSINPARSFGSAFVSGNWKSFWIYIFAPIVGMQVAAYIFRAWYFYKKGECNSMNSFMSGNENGNATYKVFRWWKKDEQGKAVKVNNPELLNTLTKNVL
jgi:aquaporin Z